MALSYGAVGTGGSGTTSITPSYPTGISASTSELVLVLTGRSNTANTAFSVPSGWTQRAVLEGGTGTWAADTGTRRVEIWSKDVVAGTESGTITVTLAGSTNNTARGTIYRIEKAAGSTISWAGSTGADTTNGTGFSATTSGSVDLAAGDFCFIAVAQNIDTGTQTAQSITSSGITFGTRTNRASTAVSNGYDHRHIVDTVPVSSGSGSNPVTYAYTISASGSGPMAFVRMRETAPPIIITVQPSNQSVNEGDTATFSVTATGADSYQWQWRAAAAQDPVVLGVDNIALTTAQNQTPSVTVPTDANAFIVGSQYYNSASQAITFSGSGWMTVQGSGGDWDFDWANNAYAFGKITATGSQTLSVSAMRAYNEGPTCQIIWLKVENPDDWVLDHQVDPPEAMPTALSVTVNSQTGGLVLGIFGNFSLPAVPSGATQIGSSQTTNGHTTLGYSVDSVGASTTTVTSASYNFPTLFAVSVKAASSAWANVSTGSGGTTNSYTTPATIEADSGKQYRCVATNAGGSVTSSAATLTVSPVLPAITVQPTNQSADVGGTATFALTAIGSAIAYQWKRRVGAPPAGPAVDEGASTGAVFSTSGPYRIATFAAGGTLAVTAGGEFEYLLVGGGGSGGGSDNSYNGGGGGGAGGFKEDSATLAVGTHTIQVGAGGAASGTSTDGNDGEGSAIVGTDSVSGGGGGGMYLNNGRAGGSGGGSGGANGTTRTGGTGISGQGYAGGSTTPDPYTGTGAGGGGAGEVGTNSPGFGGGYPPAPGGDGLQSSITGSATYYAGGGGGGSQGSGATGGLGGGGGGANYISGGVDENGYPGTDGLGGGGGGANGPNKVGGKGGDGIVIIRWIPGTGGGYTWENVVGGSGATTNSWTTPVLTIDDHGEVFRCDLTNGAGTVTSNEVTLTVSVLSGPTLKHWTGSAWSEKPLKRWNGSAWVNTGVLKRWNGSAWV